MQPPPFFFNSKIVETVTERSIHCLGSFEIVDFLFDLIIKYHQFSQMLQSPSCQCSDPPGLRPVLSVPPLTIGSSLLLG